VTTPFIAIEVMVVKMERGHGSPQGGSLCVEPPAAPMLSGTLVTIAGFLPVGFAPSTPANTPQTIFWIVGFALIVSWIIGCLPRPIWRQDAARDQND